MWRDALSPLRRASSNCSSFITKPPPVPPNVELGRITSGKPIFCAPSIPSRKEFAICLGLQACLFWACGPWMLHGFQSARWRRCLPDQSHIVFLPYTSLISFIARLRLSDLPWCQDSYYLLSSRIWMKLSRLRAAVDMVSCHRVGHDGAGLLW